MKDIVSVLIMKSFRSIGHDTLALRGPDGWTQVGLGRHAENTIRLITL